MAINVSLQDPVSGEIKFIKVGFSWTLFLFSAVLGVPLFARKLYRWGFTMLAINLASVVFPTLMSSNAAIANQIMMLGGQVVLMMMLGIRGNEMTAKHWLARSWRFAEPQSDAARYARMRWNIADPVPPPLTNATTTATP